MSVLFCVPCRTDGDRFKLGICLQKYYSWKIRQVRKLYLFRTHIKIDFFYLEFSVNTYLKKKRGTMKQSMCFKFWKIKIEILKGKHKMELIINLTYLSFEKSWRELFAAPNFERFHLYALSDVQAKNKILAIFNLTAIAGRL